MKILLFSVLAVAMIGLMVPSAFGEIEFFHKFSESGIEVEDFHLFDEMNKIYFISSMGDVGEENTKRGLYVLDTDLKKIQFIPIPQSHISHLEVNEKSKKAYIALLNSKQQIAVIDINSGELLTPIQLQKSQLSDIPPLHNINLRDLVIDDQTNTLFVTYSMQLGPDGRNAGGIVAIDTTTNNITGKLFLENFLPTRITMDKNSKTLFIAASEGGEKTSLLKINAQRMEVTDRLEIPSSRFGEVKFLSNELFATARQYNEFGNTVNSVALMIDPVTMKIIKSNEFLNAPWGIDVDFNQKRVFVSAQSSIQILDLDSFLVIDEIEVPTWESPVRYDSTNDVLFTGASKYFGKITLVKNEIIPEEPIKKRNSNFPSYDKSPNYYLDRFYNEPEYQEWFESQFPNSSIEEVVKYQTTHIENFPDNSKTPKSYIQRYYDEPEYQEWFESQFPNSSIQNILGVTNSDVSKILVESAFEDRENSEFEKALDKISISLKLNPENLDAHIERGIIFEILGDVEKAILVFDQVHSIDPDNFEAHYGLAYNYLTLSDYSKSKMHYEAAIEIEPENPGIVSNYGFLLAQMGDSEWLQYSLKAKSLEPDNPDWIYNHAISLHELQLYDDAIQEYEQVLLLDPKDTDAMINIAVIYSEMGELDNSEKYLQMANEINPEDDIVTENFEILEEQRIEELEYVHLPKLLELNYKIQISVQNGNEREAKEYARELVTLYETKIEPFMPDNKAKSDIAENIDQVKRELKMGEYAQSGGGCLIATAAYGSELAPQVQFLRELRDNTVLQTTSGTSFMTGFNQFYYSFSPYVADYERENPVFKEAVKITLTPLLTSLTLLNYVEIDSEEEMLGYGIGIILLNVGMYIVAPAALIISLKKRLNSFRV